MLICHGESHVLDRSQPSPPLGVSWDHHAKTTSVFTFLHKTWLSFQGDVGYRVNPAAHNRMKKVQVLPSPPPLSGNRPVISFRQIMQLNLTTCWGRSVSRPKHMFMVKSKTIMCLETWVNIASNRENVEKYATETSEHAVSSKNSVSVCFSL